MHHGDGADLRAVNARAVTRVAPGEIAAAGMAGLLEHHVHEGAAPQARAPGRVGADILARLCHQRIAGEAGIGRVRMRLRGLVRRRAAPAVACRRPPPLVRAATAAG